MVMTCVHSSYVGWVIVGKYRLLRIVHLHAKFTRTDGVVHFSCNLLLSSMTPLVGWQRSKHVGKCVMACVIRLRISSSTWVVLALRRSFIALRHNEMMKECKTTVCLARPGVSAGIALI